MNWFLIALIAPVLWSTVNHIDKHLLSKHQEGRGVGAILIFSSLSSIVILPFIAFFYRSQIFSISFNDFLTLLFIGFLGALAFYFYLKGMEIEEASIVIPLFQFDPIFGYVLSYFILKESLVLPQILSALLILLGILILSVEIDIENKFRFKKRVLSLIMISSFFFALNGVLFKKLALADSFWISIFWQYVGITLFGIIILLFFKKFRQDFMALIGAPRRLLALNAFSESMYIIGGVANNFALLMAPVALVFVVNSYQSFFVFIIGVTLTKIFPQFITEKITTRHFFHKLISIIIILIGTYFLYSTSY